jgi:hypothetical protein
VKGIFWLRTVPTMPRGERARRQGPGAAGGRCLGFGVLAEVPDRELVVGSYTQPGTSR